MQGVVFQGTLYRRSEIAYWIARALQAAQLGTGTIKELLSALEHNPAKVSNISRDFVERGR